MNHRSILAGLFVVLMFAPGALGLTLYVQERSAGGTDGEINTIFPSLSTTIDATAPNNVSASESLSFVRVETEAHLSPTTVSNAIATWSLNWKVGNQNLCGDSSSRFANTNQEVVSWSVDCYLPSYVTGNQTFYLNYTQLQNSRAYASYRLIQTEAVEMDSITILSADFSFADISNYTIIAFLLSMAAVAFFTKRWLPTGFGLTTAALIAYAASLGVTVALDHFLLFLGIAIVVMIFEAMHFGLTSGKDEQ